MPCGTRWQAIWVKYRDLSPLSDLESREGGQRDDVPLSVRLWRWRRCLADSQGCLETLRGRRRTTVGLGGCGPYRWWWILIQVEVSQQIQKQPFAHTAMRRAEREREREREGNISDAIDSWEWQTGAGWVRRCHMGQRRDMYSRLKVTERENKLEMAQKQDKAE